MDTKNVEVTQRPGRKDLVTDQSKKFKTKEVMIPNIQMKKKKPGSSSITFKCLQQKHPRSRFPLSHCHCHCQIIKGKNEEEEHINS